MNVSALLGLERLAYFPGAGTAEPHYVIHHQHHLLRSRLVWAGLRVRRAERAVDGFGGTRYSLMNHVRGLTSVPPSEPLTSVKLLYTLPPLELLA